MTTSEQEYYRAVTDCADRWVAACGGAEQPFWCEGMRLLYVYNPGRHQHAYLDLGSDLILEHDQLPQALRW